MCVCVILTEVRIYEIRTEERRKGDKERENRGAGDYCHCSESRLSAAAYL